MHSMDRRTGGAALGSALGVVVVVFLPKIWETVVFTVEEGSMLTAAFGIIFTAAVAYLPKPKP